MSFETLMLPVNVLNMEIGMARVEKASLCPPVSETHWQRRRGSSSQGRNKKDGRGAVDES